MTTSESTVSESRHSANGRFVSDSGAKGLTHEATLRAVKETLYKLVRSPKIPHAEKRMLEGEIERITSALQRPSEQPGETPMPGSGEPPRQGPSQD